MDQNSSCNYCKKKVIGFIKGLCRNNLLSKKPRLSCGNKYIDEFIQDTMSKRKHCDDFIEWIPCSEIEIYDLIIESGNSKIFNGKWDPSKREDKKKLSNINIVLKVLKGSENFDLKFLNELKIHYQCLGKCSVPFYGLTKPTRMQEYAMIMKYTIHGDLNKFLNSQSKLSWIKRVEILQSIAKSLNELHKLNIIHRDFHSGNILVDDNMEIFISDFGLSMFVNDFELSNSADLPSEPIKGVLPYVAPEVLIGKPYTKKSDIYSLGIIMWELTSLDRPFSNRSHDILLAMDIISKLRPKIVEGTPEIYQNIMEKCWNEDPLKRPDLSQLINDYENMIKGMEQSNQPVMSRSSSSDLLAFVDTQSHKYDSGSENLFLSDIDYQTKKYEINLDQDDPSRISSRVSSRTTSRAPSRAPSRTLSSSRTVSRAGSPAHTPASLSRSSSKYNLDLPKIEEGSDEEELENDYSFNKIRDLLTSLINEAQEAVEAPVKGREKKQRAASTTSQQSFDLGDIYDMLDELEEDDEYDEYDDTEDDNDEIKESRSDDDEDRGRGLKREKKAHKRQKSVHEERFEQGMLEFNKSISDFTTLVDEMTQEEYVYDPCIQYSDPRIDPTEAFMTNSSSYLDLDGFAQQYQFFIRILVLPFLPIIHYFMSVFLKATYHSNSSKNMTSGEMPSPKDTYLNSELIQHMNYEHDKRYITQKYTFKPKDLLKLMNERIR